MEEWEAWSGLPSSGHFHQPGTPTIPRDLIFIFIGSHSVWNVSGFLVMANLGWKEMAEITDSNFYGVGLIKDLVIILVIIDSYQSLQFGIQNLSDRVLEI